MKKVPLPKTTGAHHLSCRLFLRTGMSEQGYTQALCYYRMICRSCTWIVRAYSHPCTGVSTYAGPRCAYLPSLRTSEEPLLADFLRYPPEEAAEIGILANGLQTRSFQTSLDKSVASQLGFAESGHLSCSNALKEETNSVLSS